MSDDALLAMLETVADRLDRIEAQADMHSEAMTQIAEIALLAYAASGTEEPLPEALTTSPIVERAIGRHPDRLEAMLPKAARELLDILERQLAELKVSTAKKDEARTAFRVGLMESMARGEGVQVPKIRAKVPTSAPQIDRER